MVTARGTDVVLYGFGRIGRLLARILIAHTGRGDGLNLRAIVVRKGSDNDLMKRASLLRRDSVHGSFQGTITVDEARTPSSPTATRIQVIYSETRPPWTNRLRHRGRDRRRQHRPVARPCGLSQHLRCPGVSRCSRRARATCPTSSRGSTST